MSINAAFTAATGTAGPDTVRLIDEWQIEPRIWNHVHRAVDDANEPGQFILAGSAVPPDDATRHTGAGRISRFRMRPLSLFESGHSTGAISLAALVESEPALAREAPLGWTDVVDRICHGGWPGMQQHSTARAMRALRDYFEEIRRTDIARVDGIARDAGRVGRLLHAYARNISTHASTATLASDAGGEDDALDRNTVRDYLTGLERIMIVEELPQWAPPMRAQARLRAAPKRHFVDPAIAVAALETHPDGLLRDLKATGFLFESLVVRDLRVYTQSLGGSVLQYRDSNNLEVDAIVTTDSGRWAAFEVKMGQAQVDSAAASLIKFRDQIDTTKSGEPAALVVVTALGYGYTRPDGVRVVPISTLGP